MSQEIIPKLAPEAEHLGQVPEHLDQPHDAKALLIDETLTSSLGHAGAGHPNEADIGSRLTQGADDTGSKLIPGGLVSDEAYTHPARRLQRTKPRGLLATKSAR